MLQFVKPATCACFATFSGHSVAFVGHDKRSKKRSKKNVLFYPELKRILAPKSLHFQLLDLFFANDQFLGFLFSLKGDMQKIKRS
jgi:hypothetical protein